MNKVAEQVKWAEQVALKAVTDAGQTVNHGEKPTTEQVYMAALHARQDAVMINAMVALVLAQQQKQIRWLWVLFAVQLCALFLVR
jgi:hypothetical protein